MKGSANLTVNIADRKRLSMAKKNSGKKKSVIYNILTHTMECNEFCTEGDHREEWG